MGLALFSSPAPAAASPQTTSGAATGRLSALDAWRGLTVLLMLLVNNVSLGNLTPSQLQHAPWGGGLTFTDLVFPWFLFCAGAALPFSLSAAQRAGQRGWALVGKQAQRTVLLYLVGCVVTSATEHRFTLGLGVLQIIALASFCGGLLSGLPVRWRLAVAGVLLVGYDLFIKLSGVGGAAGLFTEVHNPVQAINALLTPWGLRGLPSVIPTTALVLLGSAAAQPLKNRHPRAPWLLLGLGIALTLLGWVWAGHLEFNKAVWTPSYVVYCSGLGTLGLLAFYLIADAGSGSRARWLTPLTIPGRNALFAYVAPILIKTYVLLDWNVTWAGGSMPMGRALLTLARDHLGLWGGGWLYTLGYILAVWLGLAYLARRGWLWKL
ncbi:heparan-alpha-glucosaminide N-acetyltransferase domain-containing protein [Deinococcus ruber]|nr:DUF5009 domain-containing protein [Deinococcus ruber]